MTVTASGYERRENDLYSTEPWVTRALLRHLDLRGRTVWEPAAGEHKMADVLAEQADMVITSDVATYSRRHSFTEDFLTGKTPFLADVRVIVTNPPYGVGNRIAVRFAEVALERCDGWVALLLTGKFDFGNTRQHLFRNNRRFHSKIALIDRISWTGDGKTGTEDHAWYLWSPTVSPHTNNPSLFWEGK